MTSELFNISKKIAEDLYKIAITDAWEQGGGNIKRPDFESNKSTMAAVFSGIKSTGGLPPSRLGGRHIKQSEDEWIAQGRRVISARQGVCTDCAAAVVVELLRAMNANGYGRKVEIISNVRHAFVVVNRDGEINSPHEWGQEAFVVDIWYRNQFPLNTEKAVAYINDDNRHHWIVSNIFASPPNLRVEANFRDFLVNT